MLSMRSREMIAMNAVATRNIKFLSHSDQGGRGDGVQVMVHRGHAYIGTRVSRGVVVTDVRDPRQPKPVNFMPIHPNSWCMHLQTANDLLLCIEELDLKALLARALQIHHERQLRFFLQPPADGQSPVRLDVPLGTFELDRNWCRSAKDTRHDFDRILGMANR